MSNTVRHGTIERFYHGPLRDIAVEDVAHLAALKLACEGYRNRVMDLGLDTVEAFGCMLLTPGKVNGQPELALSELTEVRIPHSALYRFIGKYRSTAERILQGYIDAASSWTNPQSFLGRLIEELKQDTLLDEYIPSDHYDSDGFQHNQQTSTD